MSKACLLLFLRVQNGPHLITQHNLPQKCITLSMLPLQILQRCDVPCISLSVTMGRNENTPWDFQDPVQLCAQCCHSNSTYWDRTIWHPFFCTEFSICTMVSGSVTKSACSGLYMALPAHSKHMELNHHHYLQHTWSIIHGTHTPINFSRLTLYHPQEQNHCPLPCLDKITTWYAIFKLCCNGVYISYSPSQLHYSTQVSASVLTMSNTQLCHPHCHNSAPHEFQLYKLHIIKF
jgi:hypothetical protein